MSRINTNVQSLIGQRVLGANNNTLNTSLERLSTGLRINRGKDDPAGLIASENLRAEKAAITSAISNAERADQVMNIAEGGLTEVSSLLTELESLVDSSANESGLSNEEKEANQLQIDSILQTVDRIANSTSFQGMKLLNGSFDYTLSSNFSAANFDEAVVNAAREVGTTGKILNRLFQQTFTVAKQIRTDTDIGANAVSVAYAAVNLSRNIFADLSRKTVLMVGAGETIELTARHFRNAGVERMIVANRTLRRARELGAIFNAEAIALAELPARLHEADIVISSTASTLPILGKGMVEEVLRQRKRRPMFMVDLAMPRDIEPQVAELADVYLYAIDDLRGVVDENLETRKAAARDAERIIETQTGEFMRWLRSLDSVPTIRSLHDQLQVISNEEAEKATRRLQAGDDPEEVVRNLARALSRKFAHRPVQGLNRDASGELSEAARRLFGLGDAKES